jgi:hypothetical protein
LYLGSIVGQSLLIKRFCRLKVGAKAAKSEIFLQRSSIGVVPPRIFFQYFFGKKVEKRWMQMFFQKLVSTYTEQEFFLFNIEI